MATITRHMMTDGQVPLDKVIDVQVREMNNEAAMHGKSLTNVTLAWTGTVAQASEDNDFAHLVPEFISNADAQKMTIIVHTAEVLD